MVSWWMLHGCHLILILGGEMPVLFSSALNSEEEALVTDMTVFVFET